MGEGLLIKPFIPIFNILKLFIINGVIDPNDFILDSHIIISYIYINYTYENEHIFLYCKLLII